MADTDVDIRVSFRDRFKKKSSFIFDLFYPGVLSMWRERKKESYSAARFGGIPQIWCIQRANCGEIFSPVEFYFWWNFWCIQEVAKFCQFFAIKIQFLPQKVKFINTQCKNNSNIQLLSIYSFLYVSLGSFQIFQDQIFCRNINFTTCQKNNFERFSCQNELFRRGHFIK